MKFTIRFFKEFVINVAKRNTCKSAIERWRRGMGGGRGGPEEGEREK